MKPLYKGTAIALKMQNNWKFYYKDQHVVIARIIKRDT